MCVDNHKPSKAMNKSMQKISMHIIIKMPDIIIMTGSKFQCLQNPDLRGSTTRSEKVVPLGMAFRALATSTCRTPTMLSSPILEM